jgi:hypothetical protein
MSNDDPLLTAALRGIAEEDARAGVSEAVTARLRAEFHAVSGAARLRQGYRGRARLWRYGAMLAAAAALVAAITATTLRGPSTQPAPAPPATLESREIVTEFMPLTYGDVPFSGGQLVRLQVPRTALASFGLTPPDAAQTQSTDTVLADVIVGDDGLARAVRFVRSGP